MRDDDFTEADEAPLLFEAFVEASGSGLVTGGSLTLPGGETAELLPADENEWAVLRGFEIFGAMEGAFPPGAYQMQIDTANDGSPTVALNSVVTFQFNEPMDTTVAPDEAITWSGLPDPSLFSYLWGPDGHRLLCNYTPGLPASATVQWALNPSGSASKLRDAAGNLLPEGFEGQFTTSAVSNVDEPDVLNLIPGKARFFSQDGPTPLDLGSYSANLLADFSGIGTVASIDLAIPGRGTARNAGRFENGYREVDSELSFAEPADLNTSFPSGDYTVTFHTVHDGEQSIPLTIGADDYPNPPTVRDFASTQAIDHSRPLTLSWEPMENGTTADCIEVFIESEFACYFGAPDPGQPGTLDGTATSVTIPANTLPPGRSLSAELVFIKVVDTDSTSYSGVEGIAAFASITEFQMQTTGDPFVPQLDIVHDGTQATVTVTAEVGRFYLLRGSHDLQDWFPMGNQFLGGDCDGFAATFQIVDQVAGISQRFYQVVPVQIME